MAGNKTTFNPEDPAQRAAANAANRQRLAAEASQAATAAPPAAPARPTPAAVSEGAGGGWLRRLYESVTTPQPAQAQPPTAPGVAPRGATLEQFCADTAANPNPSGRDVQLADRVCTPPKPPM